MYFRPMNIKWADSSPNPPVKSDFFICREIIRLKEKSESLSPRYSHCVLEWIRDWPSQFKEEILAESLIFANTGSYY